jgi:alkaline phosphatase D
MNYGTARTRRQFLVQSGAWLAAAAAAQAWQRKFSTDPFQLGVASGDPSPDGFVIWTRLAPELLFGGGMAPENVPVSWEVAADERMSRILKKGRVVATPEMAHSVHVEVHGLEPNRWYWYRFNTGGVESTIGRSRTFPRAGDTVDQVKFAFASCQHYEGGYYTAYQHMADEDLDLVIHLGDYIYEYAMNPGGVRQHLGGEAITLLAYRNRYAQYRTDPDLQRAHAMFPWITVADDHEVQNNYAAAVPQDTVPHEEFLKRRASAYQAYYEHMPLRRASVPVAAAMQLFRRATFGNLANFHVLDTRQYRSDQPCGDGSVQLCPEALSENLQVLSGEQERWLFDGLERSRTKWNVLANPDPIMKFDWKNGPEEAFNMDGWYEVPRTRLLEFLSERSIRNAVFVAGDYHSNWVVDLKTDFRNMSSPVIATEFIGTSISSGGDGSEASVGTTYNVPENSQVKHYSNLRGYVRCAITPKQWQADLRVVPYITRPGAPISTSASFVVEDGRAEAMPA